MGAPHWGQKPVSEGREAPHFVQKVVMMLLLWSEIEAMERTGRGYRMVGGESMKQWEVIRGWWLEEAWNL